MKRTNCSLLQKTTAQSTFSAFLERPFFVRLSGRLISDDGTQEINLDELNPADLSLLRTAAVNHYMAALLGDSDDAGDCQVAAAHLEAFINSSAQSADSAAAVSAPIKLAA